MSDHDKAVKLLNELIEDYHDDFLDDFFNSYDKFTAHTDRVPDEEKLNYYFLNLVSEAGEVAGLYAKFIRDVPQPTCREDLSHWDKKQLEFGDKLGKELGDLLWSVSRICDHYGLDLPETILGNAEKLTDRIKNNTISGSGDDR